MKLINEAALPEYSTLAQQLKPGSRYEHYSGKLYELVVIPRHSETLDELVIYQALYGDMNFWVRPLEMFCEDVEIKGCKVPRFRWIESG